MSLDAMRWAFQQNNLRSSVKFVLVALADRANEDNECWPSRETLAADTCLNPETVSKATEELEELGLIEKHRRFAGSVVFKLLGVEPRHPSAGNPAKGKNPIKGKTPQRGNPAPNLSIHINNSSSKKTPAAKTEPFDPTTVIPEKIDAAAWCDWVAYLKSRRKSPTPHTVTLQQRRLATHDAATQRQMIETSIERGWLGLFDPEQKTKKPGKAARERSIADDLTDRSWAT